MRNLNPYRALAMAALSLGATSAVAAPGDHIGGDNATLVPSLDVGVQHRTNVYLQEGEAGGGVPVTAGTALYVTPAISLTADSDVARLGLDFSYTARKFFQADVQNLDRFNILEGGLRLDLLPRAVVGVKLRDQFALSGYEAEDPAQVTEDAYQQHLRNDLAGYIAVHPGGPLEVDVGGRLIVDRWSVPEEFKSNPTDRDTDLDLASSLSGPFLNSRLAYGPSLRAKWRFFPKTAVVLDADYQAFDWQDNVVDAQGDGVSSEEVGDFLGVPDGALWKARAGLRGRVTDKIVVTGLLGYGQIHYDETSVTSQAEALGLGESSEFASTSGFTTELTGFSAGIVGEATLEYSPVEAQAITLSYRRDFQDVYFTNFAGFDRLSLDYEGKFVDRFGLKASGMYRAERYNGEVSRTDSLLKVSGEAAWYVKDYLSIKAGTGWHGRRSLDGNNAEIEYDDVRVYGGVSFVY